MRQTTWKGHTRYDFSVNEREGLVVVPANPAEGNPWIWRAAFFDAFAQADMAMLQRGWHLAYYEVSDMYGCPEAVRLMRSFQGHVESQFHLAKKTVLFGFSRGGFYSFNYAAEYPEQVSGLYLDAPALDIRSWPGGYGKAPRAEKEWQECLQNYGLTEETARDFKGNPLDKIDQVAEAGIPILVVYGDADKDAIFSENAEILIRRYRELGGEIKSIVKPGGEHHPHSLEDPAPIVEYLIANCNS
ncbi:alpha/beta hydrolase family protein [Cohnella terricola]|nr:alpha/beta fold hydrolase [Cohnella terricola]